MTEYVNAAPLVVDNGINDKSTRQLPTLPIQVPQHLPKIYIKAEKGPVGSNYVDHQNQDIRKLYGDETFEVGSKYYHHQTPLLLAAAEAQNNVVVHRLVGKDAKDVSNLVLYLDVLEENVPLYKKNDSGELIYDQEGNPEVEETEDGVAKMVKGFKVCWVLDHTVNDLGDYVIGTQKERAGIQTGVDKDSTQYPIIEISARDVGKAGDKIAALFSALTQNDKRAFPSEILTDGKMYPYNLSLNLLKDEVSGETSTILNSFGGDSIRFVLRNEGIHPNTKGVIDLITVMKENYIDVPLEQASGIGAVHVYNDNYSKLVKKFYEAEVKVVDEHSDDVINAEENNYDVINIFSFVNSNGSPYQAIKLVDEVGSVRLTRNSRLYLAGGDDGELTDEEFDRLVGEDIENYGNPLHPYQNLAKHPESDFYDTGFSLATKLKLGNFIANRKDTFVVTVPFIHGTTLSLEDQYALAVTLNDMFALHPESTVYGTKAVRALVLGASGEIIGSKYTKRLPLGYQLFKWAAAYMGNRSGNWVPGKLFDRQPGNIISDMKNIDIDWVPATTRNKLWSANLNFPLTNSVREHFIPALKTICKDDTSVLNSYFVVKAACYLNKIGHSAWRRFSGSISLTDAQLCERVNEYIAEECRNRFDNLFRVVPETVVTERDEIRGFSWTTVIKLYANNMKTAMSLTIETYRFSDYEGQ